MADRSPTEPEPEFRSNLYKFWWRSYRSSAVRQTHIDFNHVSPQIDSHDIKFQDLNVISIHREHSRIYTPNHGYPIPRECAKLIEKYRRCRQGYGVYSYADDVPQCSEQKFIIMEDCPHWVLEKMAYNKRVKKRFEMIDRITYDRAMEVSDYNK